MVQTTQIFQYWHSSAEIPPYISPLLDSFRSRNAWAKHRIFDENSAERFIAEHFSGREVAAFRSCAVRAMQADYFRYCAVLACGGLYADADMECLDSLAPLFAEGAPRAALFRRPNNNVMNAFFAFHSEGHPLLRLALDVATAAIERRVAEDVWLVTGPGVFTYLAMLHQYGSFAAFERFLKDDDYDAVPRFGRLICETAGSFDRLHAAWAGVQILPEDQFFPYAIFPNIPFPYKETEVHWTNVKGSIFAPQVTAGGNP